jgi:integrase
MKVKLTKDRIAAAKAALLASTNQQAVVFDAALPGFGIRISRNAIAAFLDYRDAGGAKRRLTIGRIPGELSIDQARKIAAAKNVEIRAGCDPVAERRAARVAAKTGLKVSEAIDVWLADGAAEWSPITLSTYRRVMAHDVTPALGKLLVSELGRAAIMSVIAKVKARSRSSASLLLKVVKSFVSHLDDQGIASISLPKAKKVAPAPKPRTRTPSGELLVTIWKACGELTPKSSAMMRIILLTAQRRRTVELMRWSDLDLDRGLWRIPGEHMKSRKPHTVALAPIAIAQLAGLRRSGPYVFSDGTRPPCRIVDVVKALRPFTGPDWSPHDVRRSMVSWATSSGFQRAHASVAIGHVITRGVDKSYDQHSGVADFRCFRNDTLRIIDNVGVHQNRGERHHDQAKIFTQRV